MSLSSYYYLSLNSLLRSNITVDHKPHHDSKPSIPDPPPVPRPRKMAVPEEKENKSSLVNTQESRELVKLFDVIDKLRSCGVSEDISLPQLCVVGDQSSGKSSILEALTGIPFPVASTLCTRFATQINFRHSTDEKVIVTIIPSQDRDETTAQRLRNYTKKIKSLTTAGVESVLEEASDEMGLPKPGAELESASDNGGPRFADDVLKIELNGPDKPHFSVVDVPGLFQSATRYQTDADAIIVENLVKRYITEPRTIILAVASALHETANQKVFRLASEVDPKGLRTVGLLTKPDAVQPGDESRVLEVAMNRVTVLTHGWFVCRNRSTNEVMEGVTLTERGHNEKKFFSKDPWRVLDRNRVGIEALGRFLKKLLFDHIRKEYPVLVQELDDLLEDCQRELEDLGIPRETAEQQRGLLIDVASRFQAQAGSAIKGTYDPSSQSSDDIRLRMRVRNTCDIFAGLLKKDGHEYCLSEDNASQTRDWIEEVYRNCRGRELPGMVNADIVMILFKMQTQKWERMGRKHVQDIRGLVEAFNKKLLQSVCPDQDLRSRIWSCLQPIFQHGYREAENEFARILESERDDGPITYDDHFLNDLEKLRRDRLKQRMVQAVSGTEDVQNIQIHIEQAYESSEDQCITEVQNILRSYYEIARNRFLECVALHVVERHFLGKGGPVRAFSPAFVGQLPPETLQAIAGEDFFITNKRQNLRSKLERLEQAKNIANAGYI